MFDKPVDIVAVYKALPPNIKKNEPIAQIPNKEKRGNILVGSFATSEEAAQALKSHIKTSLK